MKRDLLTIRRDLENKIAEINLYLKLPKVFDQSIAWLWDYVEIKYSVLGKRLKYSKVDNQISQTLNWIVYIMLYNIIEWTINKSINCIYFHLIKQNIKFHQLAPKAQASIAARYINKIQGKDSIVSLSSLTNIKDKNIISQEIYSKLKEEKNGTTCFYKFNWNINYKNIKKVANTHWIKITYESSGMIKNQYQIYLNKICIARQNLSHGSKTFKEEAQNQSLNYNEIEKMLLEIDWFLNQFIIDIDNYIKTQSYKKE